MARQNTRNRIGNNQTEALINYMEQHSLFARGQICKLGAQGNIKYKKMWEDLTNLLNRIGPSNKCVTAWQKCWTNMRLLAKLKKAKFLKELTKTGHNTPDAELSENDWRISQIYGKYGTGVNLGGELGFRRTEDLNFEEDEFPFDSVLLLRVNSLVTEPLHSFLDFIPSRISNFFEELSQNLLNLHQNNNERKKPQKKPTDLQIRCLIEYMERHQDLANGRDANADNLWQILVTLLHNNRGAFKTLAAWKRTWSGMVTAARQNMRFLLDGRKTDPMSENHIKIIDIVGYREEDIKPPTSIFYNNPSHGKSRHDQIHPSSSRSTDSSFYEPPTNWKNNRPYTSTSSSSYEPRISPYWNNNNRSTCRPSSLFEQPSTSMNSYSQPSNTPSSTNHATPSTSRSTNTAENSHAVSSTTSVAGKSAKIIETLEQKGQELVKSLTDQLISCFEKQNHVLTQGLQGLSDTLVRTMPILITQEFQKVLEKNCQLIPNDTGTEEDSSTTIVASGTIEYLLLDEADDNDCDQLFKFIEKSVVDKEPEEGKCPICQDTIRDAKEVECKHTFCKLCIDTWLMHSDFCPMCRTNVRSSKELTWAELVLDDSEDDF